MDPRLESILDGSLGTDNLPGIGALTPGAPALQEVGALAVLFLQVGKQAQRHLAPCLVHTAGEGRSRNISALQTVSYQVSLKRLTTESA